MKKILILGGGFAGLIAAENLSGFFGDKHQTTLISPDRDFTFYPGLVRLAFEDLTEDYVKFNLEEKLDKLDVRFVEGKVLEIKPEFNRVKVAGSDFNGQISYDYLVIAIGRRLAAEQIPGFFEYAHHLLDIDAAKKFGKAMKDFSHGQIVVGLSPDALLPVPVCETAFALSKRFRPDIKKKRISVTAVFPETIKEAFGGANIHWELEKAFENHGIKVVSNFQTREIEENKILSKAGKSIPFDLLMLIPPFRGQANLAKNKFADELGFFEVDGFMQVKGMKNVYAAGDITALPGPKLAQTAIEQAEVAAANIMLLVDGLEPDAFYYHEIDSIIDAGGADSIYLNYGVWDKKMYTLKRGRMWTYIKRLHHKIWKMRHKSAYLDKGL